MPRLTMPRPAAAGAALALGVVLVLDVLRVWLPSIITIFGQAASTPPEQLGAFGLVWFAAAFAAPALARPLGAARLALAAGALLAAARLALPLTDGGQPQLYVACAGVLLGVGWLAGLAMTGLVAGGRLAAALAGGLALAALQHAALATVDLTWRAGWWVWPLLLAEAALFVACLARALAGPTPARTPAPGQAPGPSPGPSPDPPPNPAPGPAPKRAALLGANSEQGSPVPGGARTGEPSWEGAAAARGWLLVGPAMLLAGAWVAAPALVITAVSYWSGRLAGLPGLAVTPGLGGAALTATLVAACAAGLVAGAVLVPRRRWAVLAAAAGLPATALVFGLGPVAALLPAIPLGAVALGGCLGAACAGRPDPEGAAGARATGTSPAAGPSRGTGPSPAAGPSRGTGPSPAASPSRGSGPSRSPARAGYAAAGGMLVFAVGAVAYYAAYDAGYPNWWVPAAAALLVALTALPVPVPLPAAERRGGRRVGRLVGAGAAAVLLAAAGVWWAPPGARAAPDATSLQLVAYNIRMGFGMAGRFEPDALAAVVASEGPDVVVLSEVDRAWLLNGGHDTLDALARRLGMRYVFAPAADAVWGDAVLTRLPVRDAATVVLPRVGAPTGAQALGVVVEAGGAEIAVVSTHLQPPPGGPPLAQARELARFADEFRAGRPAVVAGDLNVEPGSASMRALADAGFADALAAARPLRTSPADAPVKEIDHVLVTADLEPAGAVAPRSTASDHLAVAVTLRLPT